MTAKWQAENHDVEPTEIFNEGIDIGQTNVKKGQYPNERIKLPYELPKNWRWVTLKQVANFKSGYAFKSRYFVSEGIQLVRMGNLYKNILCLDKNPVFLPRDYDENIIKKYSINEGDILLSLTGTKYKRDYGYAVKVNKIDNNLVLNQRILSLTPYKLNNYFYYYLQSPIFRDIFFSFETGGVNQGNVSGKAVETILFPLPPIEEGVEIERIIDTVISYEKNADEFLEVEHILDSLSNNILSKAFRGQLGTNDPAEESAIELLKETLQDKVKSK